MSNTIEDRVSSLETRMNALEVTNARIDTKLEALVKSTDNLRKTVWAFMFGFGLLLIGALIYGALGEKGFNSVM